MSDIKQYAATQALIHKLVEHTRTTAAANHIADLELFIQFIRLYYAYSAAEDLTTRGIEDLYGAARSHWQLMQQRQPQELKIRVFNPQNAEDGWQSPHTVVEVVVDDMPFLVDSMRMEMNHMGLTQHLMIHTGGMRVVRDQQGMITAVLPFAQSEPKAVLESPLYMEIDRQTDPAILEEVKENITHVLGDVRLTVNDWGAMRDRVKDTIARLSVMKNEDEEIKESIAFLEWILSDHFTLLGARDYEVVGQGEGQALHLIEDSSLGVLRDCSQSREYRPFSELPEAVRKRALTRNILLLSKTNTRSTVHRHSYTDCISVQIYDQKDHLVLERRFIGLYTSSAYTSSPKTIPVVARKVEDVISQSGLPPRSHAGKDLLHILSTLPRDDLFHASAEELYDLSIGILHLQERRKISLFVREDAYGRFISCLVYVPRENFNANLVRQMEEILKQDLGGLEVSLSTQFSSSILVRIHYLIRVDARHRQPYDLKQIEQKLGQVGESWQDGFRAAVVEYFGEERGNELVNRYRNAFPASYREAFAPQNAIFDVEQIEPLAHDHLGMSFYRPLGASKEEIRFKLYSRDATVALSDVLPMLENMGLRVESEQPYTITLHEGGSVSITDFGMRYAHEPEFEVEQVKGIFQRAFNKIWLGEAENDNFNRLVLEAQLSWREITILRAYSRYFRQTEFTFSHEYIGQALVNNASIARMLVELFHYRFVPQEIEDREEKLQRVEAAISKQLDNVVSLDDDRILRRYLHVINATLRTNYFQTDAVGHSKSYLSFKLDLAKIPDLPLPLPEFEIFIHSPRFEGTHLRAGKVARGGLRWSDRREDFRTEVLGLMKAQKVKNSVIVPTGAKGGFVLKKPPTDGSREALFQEGTACYREYVSALLEITDNLKVDEIIPPTDCVCYDNPDPYLVVAADKGTATFSDTANSVAIEKNFWMGDAFASGGSAGYDHKKIGITARGAWVSARRQFQELGVNVDTAEISVVGIGDMSGDVFGNGMLLSPHLKLVAAFNHQHIFLDPDPDPVASFAERQRLFNLPRSTWADYNRDLISTGGGVYSRAVKSISLSPAIKRLLGVEKDILVPNELIRAILKAPVDMIWNGGIGTYVKSSMEVNQDVGDRSNDAVRVNGGDLQAKVVCEGGNLGCTQLGRVEYELSGGKINTDFIDNSGGVDCSDHEVNIKILLNPLIAAGRMTEEQRNSLLAEMTNEVANLVLVNNYQQNRAIGWLSSISSRHLGLYINYINALEQAGKIDRGLEFLPSNKELLQRKIDQRGITKPEMAILLAYSKITLKEEIIHSDLPEDEYLSLCLKEPFPLPLRKKFAEEISHHRLRREIIATQLGNRIVSDMGVTFIFQMQDETTATAPKIIRAYAAARSIFHMGEFYIDIESLDYKIDAQVQYQINEEAVTLLRRASRWLLRYRKTIDVPVIIQDFTDAMVYLSRRLPKYILGDDLAALETRRDQLIAADVPPDIALRVACAEPMYHGLNIVEVSKQEEIDIHRVAPVYFTLLDRLKLIWFRQQINAYAGGDSYWVFLAKSTYKAELDTLQMQLTRVVLRHIDLEAEDVAEQVDAWLDGRQSLVERWRNILTDLRNIGAKEFAIISVAIRELSNLARSNNAA